MTPIALCFALFSLASQDLVHLGEPSAAQARRAWIGVGLTSDEEPGRGVGVAQVRDGSPAERAGLRVGDRLVALDGEALAGIDVLRELLARRRPGQRVELDVRRVFEVVLDERGHGEQGRPRLGVTLSQRGEDLWVISTVEEGWPAAAAGLQGGDRIVTLQGRPVGSFDELMARLSGIAPGGEVRLDVARTIPLELGAAPSDAGAPAAPRIAPEPRLLEPPEGGRGGLWVLPGPEGRRFEWVPFGGAPEPRGELRQELRSIHEGIRGLHEELRGLREELQRLRRELGALRGGR